MSEKAKTGGIGLGTIIFFIFLFMKLSGMSPVAEWSWWWVTSPLWIPTVIFIAIFIIMVTIGFLGMSITGLIDKMRK